MPEESTPNTPEAGETPATAGETPAADAEPAPAGLASEREGIDPQLIALCAVLWIAAMVIFGLRWTSMRINYHLGNIKESMQAAGAPDEGSVKALVDMAGDGDVLEHLEGELAKDVRNDPVYRAVVLHVIQQIPGPASYQLLIKLAEDERPDVRGHAYAALADRVLANDPGHRDEVVALLFKSAHGESHAYAQAHAGRALGLLGAQDARWPLIRALREYEGSDGQAAQMRAIVLDGLRRLSGKTAEELPFDVAGERSVRDEQLRAWEAWFREAGGTIPAGDSLGEVRARQAQAEDGNEEAGQPAEAGSE